jgi:hypothetical protein
MSMQTIIKKAIDPVDESAGSIDYVGKPATAVGDIKGMFVTTYYFRDSDCTTCNDFKGQDSPWVKTDVYKVGILHYLRVTELPDFVGWKVVIYLDRHSLENPVFRTNTETERAIKHKEEWRMISEHPNVVFAVVEWPEYSVGSKGDGKTIDNAILRALRFKAFHDFPDLPVFLRDADTLFENLIKGGGATTTLANFTEALGKWEKTLWDALVVLFASPNPYRILVASQPNYYRQWHVHPKTGVRTTGCYAAITSTLGNLPEFKDGSLWKACLAYLRENSQIVQTGTDRVPSNISKPTYIGKDEQLLSFVVMPAILDKVYFYYFEYIRIEGGPVTDKPETPFAKMLIQEGMTTYPSPYRESRQAVNPAPADTKEANEMTETTILNPASIKFALAAKNNELMHKIFRFYQKGSTAPAPTSATAPQAGGGKRKKSRKRSKRLRGRGRRTRQARRR